jgi:2,3-bisphosphoglycerate-dependent phosphoglycerate mutase
MKIYLVRHGESMGNINPQEYFKKLDCDIELTGKGNAQAAKSGHNILDLADYPNTIKDYPSKEPIHFNMYFSSYKRAVQTANIVHGVITGYEGYTVNEYRECPLLHERDWGSLRDIVESGKKNNGHFNFFYKPLGGESFSECYQRVVLFDMWLKSTTKYEHNIIVAHGEFNKLYLMHLLGWSVEEFEKWANPKNGEIFLVEDGKLSKFTPLTISERYIKH